MPYFYKLSNLFIDDISNLSLKTINSRLKKFKIYESNLIENKYNVDWLDALFFTLNDFAFGCYKVKKDALLSILIFNFSDNNIGIKKDRIDDDTDYEYKTNKHVDPSNIVGKLNVDFYHPNNPTDEFVDELNDLRKYPIIKYFVKFIRDEIIINRKYILDNLYLHITCRSSVDNIRREGLWSNKEVKYRIGDRKDDEDQIYKIYEENKASNTDNQIQPKKKIRINFHEKYLKYKNKYLKLKNKVNDY